MEFLNDQLLSLLIKVILRYDYFQAYEFVLVIGHKLNELYNFTAFVSIARIILSPTIYDTSYINNHVILSPNINNQPKKIFNFAQAVKEEMYPNEVKLKLTDYTNDHDQSTNTDSNNQKSICC